MRKFIYLLTLVLVITLSACHSNRIDEACKGAKTLARCCQTIKATTQKVFITPADNPPSESAEEITAPLPAYTWDSKMMLF